MLQLLIPLAAGFVIYEALKSKSGVADHAGPSSYPRAGAGARPQGFAGPGRPASTVYAPGGGGGAMPYVQRNPVPPPQNPSFLQRIMSAPARQPPGGGPDQGQLIALSLAQGAAAGLASQAGNIASAFSSSSDDSSGDGSSADGSQAPGADFGPPAPPETSPAQVDTSQGSYDSSGGDSSGGYVDTTSAYDAGSFDDSGGM